MNSIHPKVKAGTTTAAVVAAIALLLSATTGFDVPTGVQDAIVVLAGFVGGFLKSA